MNLPFTEAQFLDVFAGYNAALWPAAAVLWIASAALVAIALRGKEPPHRALSALLAALWAWSALAYHAAYFTRINPAAWLFAGLFLIEALLLFRSGVMRHELRFSRGRSPRHLAAAVLIAVGVAYPFLNLLQGLEFPRMPTFGVPCPTTILTAGLLLAAERPSWKLAGIPLAWSIIAGSSALVLGVYADLMLLAAAGLLGVFAGRRPLRSSPVSARH